MSSRISVDTENVDQAVAIGLLYYQTSAPIAVYVTDASPKLLYPYDAGEVGKVLESMGTDKLYEAYKSINVL